MQINTDINILGGLPDFNLIHHFLAKQIIVPSVEEAYHTYTSIKTDKSVKRFERAINRTFLQFKNQNIESLFRSIVAQEPIGIESLWIIFWNASLNNELLHYLNSEVYFPALYSGKLLLNKEDVTSCIRELREYELPVKGWTNITIETVARKYLTFLKKLNLLEGGVKKTILHPYLNDKMFILFVYWINAIEYGKNIINTQWLGYSFCDKTTFLERIQQKKYIKYFHITFTGDKLMVETLINYKDIYYDLQ